MKFFVDEIYFIQQGCLNWIIYLYRPGQPLEFINAINHTFFDEELRDFQLSLYFFTIYLHFDHFIYELSDNFTNVHLLYEENDGFIIKVTASSTGFTIIQKDFNDYLKITNIGKQYSYSINQKLNKNFHFLFAYKTDYLVGLNDNNLLYLSYDTNVWENYNIQMNKVSNFLQSNILLGFDDKNIILIYRLKNLPFFSCSEINGKSERLKIIQILSPQFSTSTNFVELVKVDENLFQLQNQLDELYHQHEFLEYQFIYSLHLQSFLMDSQQCLLLKIHFRKQKQQIFLVESFLIVKFQWEIHQFGGKLHIQKTIIILFIKLHWIIQQLIIATLTQPKILVFLKRSKKNLYLFSKIKLQYTQNWQMHLCFQTYWMMNNIIYKIASSELNKLGTKQIKIQQKLNEKQRNIFLILRLFNLSFRQKPLFVERSENLIKMQSTRKYNLHKALTQFWNNLVDQLKFWYIFSSISNFIQNISLIDIFQWGEIDNLLTLIYSLKNSDEILIGQFNFDNFKLTNMFDFPLHNLTINVPLKFNYYKGQIAILASNKENSNLVKYILIYKLSQTYTTCLKQIIKTDSQFFQVCDLNSIIYQKENHFFQKELIQRVFNLNQKMKKNGLKFLNSN